MLLERYFVKKARYEKILEKIILTSEFLLFFERYKIKNVPYALNEKLALKTKMLNL